VPCIVWFPVFVPRPGLVRRLGLLLLPPMLLCGCSPAAICRLCRRLPPGSKNSAGAGRRVRIITYGEDPLTGEFRVNDQGALALPLAGPVKAAGQTPRELEEAGRRRAEKGRHAAQAFGLGRGRHLPTDLRSWEVTSQASIPISPA